MPSCQIRSTTMAAITPLPVLCRWLCDIQSPGLCLFGQNIQFCEINFSNYSIPTNALLVPRMKERLYRNLQLQMTQIAIGADGDGKERQDRLFNIPGSICLSCQVPRMLPLHRLVQAPRTYRLHRLHQMGQIHPFCRLLLYSTSTQTSLILSASELQISPKLFFSLV